MYIANRKYPYYSMIEFLHNFIKYLLTVAMVMALTICSLQKAQSQIDKGFPDEKYKKNIIKWNLTPFILWGYQNINLSYERVLKPNRSFSANAGIFQLPTVGIFDSLKIESAVKKSGFSVSGDYRFYMNKLNHDIAPRGVYWGPFASYHHYKFENNITAPINSNIEGNIILDGNVNIISTGVELGYQFIIKERLSIDLVFLGPSITIYTGNLNLEGQLTSEEYEDYLETIRDILVSKIPLFDDLVSDGNFNDKGTSTSFGFGLRYLMQIGYRF